MMLVELESRCHSTTTLVWKETAGDSKDHPPPSGVLLVSNVVFSGVQHVQHVQQNRENSWAQARNSNYSLVCIQISKDSAKLVGLLSQFLVVEHLGPQNTEKKNNIG